MDIEKTIEFILTEHAKTESLLRRAVRLRVREARNERKRRQEVNLDFNLIMTQLATAQLETAEKLKGLIEKMSRGGNGRQ